MITQICFSPFCLSESALTNGNIIQLNNEDSTSILIGFTLRYGAASLAEKDMIGGGVFLQDAFPKMHYNKIVDQTLTSKHRQNPKAFKTWVTLYEPPGKMDGGLYQVNDSSLVLIPNALIQQGYYGDNDFVLIKLKRLK